MLTWIRISLIILIICHHGLYKKGIFVNHYKFLANQIQRRNFDVYLCHLINTSKIWWEDRVYTDHMSLKKSFPMRETLIWTIKDFPTYRMPNLFGVL